MHRVHNINDLGSCAKTSKAMSRIRDKDKSLTRLRRDFLLPRQSRRRRQGTANLGCRCCCWPLMIPLFLHGSADFSSTATRHHAMITMRDLAPLSTLSIRDGAFNESFASVDSQIIDCNTNSTKRHTRAISSRTKSICHHKIS